MKSNVSSKKFWILGILTILSLAVVSMIKPIAQDQAFHAFADTRRIAGIPNFWNVATNLPFLFVAVAGVVCVKKFGVGSSLSTIYTTLFIGIGLTGIGSAYYHIEPNNWKLIFDRIPMTIVFMSFLSATVYECIRPRWGSLLLFPLVAIGVSSVLWWYHTETQNAGDLRLYGLVQFYPVIFIPVIVLLFSTPTKTNQVKLFSLIVLWYVVAKVFERFDAMIFDYAKIISGHSMKHLAAAVSTWHIVKLFKMKYEPV